MKYDVVLIIDFGSQVTQLIARRLRELKVYCEIRPFQNVSNDLIKQLEPKAIILSFNHGGLSLLLIFLI